jgi:hypothetical protein
MSFTSVQHSAVWASYQVQLHGVHVAPNRHLRHDRPQRGRQQVLDVHGICAGQEAMQPVLGEGCRLSGLAGRRARRAASGAWWDPEGPRSHSR